MQWHQADEDFRTNVEAEQRIEDLQKHLASIEVDKLNRIIELLESPSPSRRNSSRPERIEPLRANLV